MQLRTAIRTISIRESRGERIAKTDKTERESERNRDRQRQRWADRKRQ